MSHAAAWRRAAPAAAMLATLFVVATTLVPEVRADEQRVQRLGLALYVMPSGLALEDFNSEIDRLNQETAAFGQPFGSQAPIDDIKWDGIFGAELKYFVNRNIAVIGGVGQIKKESKLDLQPVADGATLIRGYVRSVPIHLGADYYFEPRTSGDFTVRPFVGGGYVRVADTKTSVGYDLVRPDSTLTDFTDAYGNGHGFFLEAGAHMMFPSRYSILINANYRNAHVKQMNDYETGAVIVDPQGELVETDISGFGLRFAVQISLWGKPPE
jgi:outer membrane protein W